MTFIERLRALTAELDSVQLLAEQFCQLTDEQQADFFEAVGRIMEGWPRDARHWGPEWQRFAIGRHMRDCTCVSDVGRRVIEDIFNGMQS